MKKSLTLLLIIVVLGSFFVEPKRAEATGESMHVRKVVSLVYDDSSSMSGGEGYKKAYANYAVQSFCGLLDTEDQLFITYMYNSKSTPNYLPEETDLSSQGIQGALDKIRAHNDEGSTPFRSVEIAFEKLKSVQDADPNTQYWLVVFTDGDFNEIQGESSDYKQQFLDEHFSELVQTRMPNGTYPNITFVAIGSEVYYPKEDTSSGLYTFFANGEKEIFSAMSGMAEMISGKTKVSTDKLFQLDEKTIQVSSEIPLRKIAILTQDTDAEIVSVGGDDGSVDIERKAHMNYPKGNLNGEAYLAGNGNASLSAGTYKITFDKPIGREGVEVLFEPALEVRIKIKVGEKEITNISELNSYTEGDQINISCGVYEIGTQNEVDVSLLPGGTSMVFTVRAGNEVRQSDKPGEEIRDYVLKNTSTEIVSELSIPGFNTIRQKVEFLPQPAPEYSLTSVLVGGPSIHYDDLAQNESLRILYTVMKDGEAVNDLNIVKSFATAHILNPIGDGNTEYLDTGQIVFTPTSVTVEKGASGTIDVTVTMNVGNMKAVDTFKVLLPDYKVVVQDVADRIVKTEFYGNQKGATFVVTKDGVQLSKAELEGQVNAVLSESRPGLKVNLEISDDGVIRVTPYLDKEHKVTFATWWTNWWYYLVSLRGGDVEITLETEVGNAETKIPVVGETTSYLITKVWLPLILEAAIVAWILWWVYCILAKPRFIPYSKVIFGELTQKGGKYYVRDVQKKNLTGYNRFKYRWKPTLKPTKVYVSAAGMVLSITAAYGRGINCNRTLLRPIVRSNVVSIHNAEDMLSYYQRESKDIPVSVRLLNNAKDSKEQENSKGRTKTFGDGISDVSSNRYYLVSDCEELSRIKTALIIAYVNSK